MTDNNECFCEICDNYELDWSDGGYPETYCEKNLDMNFDGACEGFDKITLFESEKRLRIRW